MELQREIGSSVSHRPAPYAQYSDEAPPQHSVQPRVHPVQEPAAATIEPTVVDTDEDKRMDHPLAVETTKKPYAALQSKSFDKFVLIGNPGSGKSTFINCILKEAKFTAGLSFGGGCTQFFQVAEYNERLYLDTPGLSDTTMMEQAAREIQIALTQGGRYHLLFVVRLSSGRVDKNDVNTIHRVLSCIKTGDDSLIEYSVIVNMVRKKQYNAITAHGDEYMSVMTCLNTSGFDTSRVKFVPEMEALDEEDNKVVELPEDLLTFIHESPSFVIDPSMVSDIIVDPELIAENLKQLEEKMKTMQADKDLMFRRFQMLQHQTARGSNAARSHQQPSNAEMYQNSFATSSHGGLVAGQGSLDPPTQYQYGTRPLEYQARNADFHRQPCSSGSNCLPYRGTESESTSVKHQSKPTEPDSRPRHSHLYGADGKQIKSILFVEPLSPK